MFKKALYLLLFLRYFSLFANSNNLSTIVDFGQFPRIEHGYYTDFNPEFWKLGGYAFNLAPEVTPFFAFLKHHYRLECAVETGTFLAGTTVVFASLFNHVHTIEFDSNNYNIAKDLLASYPNAQCYFGNSPTVLQTLLPTLKDKRILFYLDVHGQHTWPLLEELEVISRTHKNQCIIVIDDFKVPGRSDIPYDSYNSNECSFNYVKSHLDKVFTSYTVHFLIPKSVYSRAKCVVIPKQWAR